jgi:hypothetical protein
LESCVADLWIVGKLELLVGVGALGSHETRTPQPFQTSLRRPRTICSDAVNSPKATPVRCLSQTNYQRCSQCLLTVACANCDPFKPFRIIGRRYDASDSSDHLIDIGILFVANNESTKEGLKAVASGKQSIRQGVAGCLIP